MRKNIRISLYALAALICLNVVPFVSSDFGYLKNRLFLNHEIIQAHFAYAADQQAPYGGSKSGEYGENREVKSKEEAQKMLREYFAKKEVVIGEIKEKELYFEAEIKDKSNNLIDKVIVDKRTGRIRSIY